MSQEIFPIVQWFPGHMAKATRMITEHKKKIDVVIELLDARIPRSSANPVIRELIGDKPHVVILNKCDLANPKATKEWIEFFKNEGIHAIAIDSKNDLFEYEIFKNVKNIKLRSIFEFFTNLFHITNIKFSFSDDKYEFSFHNNIEHFKFITLGEFLTQYEKLVSDLKLFKYKNLAFAENSFYELDLLDKTNNTDEFSSWINAKIKFEANDINIGDTLKISRLHKIKFENFPYDIEEIITVAHPLTKTEVKFGKINLNRKAVKIKLNKVYK